MNHLSQILLASASALAASSIAQAGDFLIKLEGNLESIEGAGVLSAPFASGQVGDTILVEYSVNYPGVDDPAAIVINNSPVPGTNYEIDYAASTTTFGGQTISLADTVPAPYEDGVSLISGVNGCFSYAGAGSGFLSLSSWDPLQPGGTVITSDDVADLVGSPIDATQLAFPRLIFSDEIFTQDQIFFQISTITVVDEGDQLGSSYCGPAVVNSTNASAEIFANGSDQVVDNDLVLSANNLPMNGFGFFIGSRDQSLVVAPGGSQGNLCLGGAIGRFSRSGEILNSGTAGAFDLTLDLTDIPQPNGAVAAMAGETWNFQAWFRDSVAGTSTSNFTNGISVSFQ